MEASMSTPTSIPEFVDGVTFMELYNEAIRNQPAGKKLIHRNVLTELARD